MQIKPPMNGRVHIVCTAEPGVSYYRREQGKLICMLARHGATRSDEGAPFCGSLSHLDSGNTCCAGHQTRTPMPRCLLTTYKACSILRDSGVLPHGRRVRGAHRKMRTLAMLRSVSSQSAPQVALPFSSRLHTEWWITRRRGTASSRQGRIKLQIHPWRLWGLEQANCVHIIFVRVPPPCHTKPSPPELQRAERGRGGGREGGRAQCPMGA